jgi:hypothetical protein
MKLGFGIVQEDSSTRGETAFDVLDILTEGMKGYYAKLPG